MVPPYIGHTHSKVWVICVLVSQVFVFFGIFSTELLTLRCKITEVVRLSLLIEFFVGFHIICDRFTLDNAHFTYFSTIWPLSLPSTFGSDMYPWAERSSYESFPSLGSTIAVGYVLGAVTGFWLFAPNSTILYLSSQIRWDFTTKHHHTCTQEESWWTKIWFLE